MITTHAETPPDRLVSAIEDRRTTLLDVIRQARSRITLSVFRCNDDGIFAELAERCFLCLRFLHFRFVCCELPTPVPNWPPPLPDPVVVRLAG